MNARKLIIGIAALIAAAITSAGCYTIIKHPTMTTIQGDDAEGTTESYTHVEADRDCMRCHTDYGTYPYGYYYGYYPDYYWSNPKWGSYYAYPWWWEEYWYNDSPVAVDTVDQIARPEQRRGLTPPYSRGVDPIFNPLPNLPTTNTPPVVGGGGGSTTGGGGGTVTPPPTNTDDGKKEEQKPPRRRGK